MSAPSKRDESGALLRLSLHYLEHPDVKAIPFARSSDSVAKHIRKHIDRGNVVEPIVLTERQRLFAARALHDEITASDELWDTIDQSSWLSMFDRIIAAAQRSE